MKILLTSKGENISALKIENKIKNMNNNINSVIAYVKNDKVCIDIYVSKEFDCSKLINRYNNSAISYEKIDNYRVYLDSFDTRLK